MKTYLLGIAAAAMAVAVLNALLREGAVKKTVALAGGVLLILSVLAPAAKGTLDTFGEYIAGLQLQTDAAVSGIEVENRQIMADIIREKTEAYILDKAAQLGAAVEVEVEVQQGTEYPYPWSVTVSGSMTQEQRRLLCSDLAVSLAIPEERQVYLP